MARCRRGLVPTHIRAGRAITQDVRGAGLLQVKASSARIVQSHPKADMAPARASH